jgi:hypothetical protein
MQRHRLGKTFVNPTASLQGPFHRAFTGLKALMVQVVDQHIRAPARFEITIRTGMLGQHGLQQRESSLLFAIGASNRWCSLEPFDPVLQVGFEPTADRVFMTLHGLGNGGHPLATIRQQDRQTAFGKV